MARRAVVKSELIGELIGLSGAPVNSVPAAAHAQPRTWSVAPVLLGFSELMPDE